MSDVDVKKMPPTVRHKVSRAQKEQLNKDYGPLAQAVKPSELPPMDGISTQSETESTYMRDPRNYEGDGDFSMSLPQPVSLVPRGHPYSMALMAVVGLSIVILTVLYVRGWRLTRLAISG
jgi:hypothetical protein